MTATAPTTDIDGRAAWLRLAIAVVLSTIGGVGLWSAVVALPAVQAEFGTARADAALPYSLLTISFGFGGVLMGRLADRVGIAWPAGIGALLLGLGYVAAAAAPSMLTFALAHALLIGIGSSATFAPLIADTSHWFVRRRGIAVAISACGNYLAGTLWPPVVQHLIDTAGWRKTHVVIGVICVAAMLPLVFALRRRAPAQDDASARGAAAPQHSLAVSPAALQVLLVVAGLACCVAMSMPQVHIVAYCGDLGYGVARGAEMLSLMLGFGIVSRVASGFIADRIGGLYTLLIGSLLQGVALFLYLLFDGLASLYVISALFGLFQGGIVPSYAIIIREYFSPQEAGTRVGLTIMATLFGMALGGWLSGLIFDLTGSYRAAFANGLAWNLLNGAVVLWLIWRSGAPRLRPAVA
ncbi:MAG TPA: MFS transporter [Beijerinckiaceae bacterium]|nr:MFS transporter [Beijerinckiaceae bacterium]